MAVPPPTSLIRITLWEVTLPQPSRNFCRVLAGSPRFSMTEYVASSAIFPKELSAPHRAHPARRLRVLDVVIVTVLSPSPANPR